MLKKTIDISFFFIFLFIVRPFGVWSQQLRILKLDDVIKIATDSSLSTFKGQNLYLSSYWDYRSYLAQLKPNVSFTSNPVNYNRSLIKRYNSTLDIDEYRSLKSITSNANATLSQNILLTGGTLSVNSELERIQSFGINNYTQYSSVPIRIGLNQPLFAFNTLKWQRKIEPLIFEKAKKDYLKTIESISLQTVDYFFNMYSAQSQLKMAIVNVANADTFYNIGVKRMEMASLSMADLLILRMNYLNTLNNLEDAKRNLTKTESTFYSFLRNNINRPAELVLPELLPNFQVDFNDAYSEVLANNPDILGNKQQLLESFRDLERARHERFLQASFKVSYGFNQKSNSISEAFLNPLDQQGASISLSFPIIDWGLRTGKYTLGKRNLELAYAMFEQATNDFQENLRMLVINFNSQQNIIKRNFERNKIADQAYEITKQRFSIGKVDVNTLNSVQSLKDQSLKDYINSLRAYWEYYYNIRILTLFDFSNKKKLSRNFDELLGFL